MGLSQLRAGLQGKRETLKIVEEDRQKIGLSSCLAFSTTERQCSVLAVVGCCVENRPTDGKKKLSQNMLDESSNTWLDGPIAKGMIDVCRMHYAILA